MTGARISVITVTRNLITEGRADAIRAAIICVQAQGRAAFEHVIWDGASTDGTQDLLQQIVDEMSARPDSVPIRLVSQPDQGLYDAMNRAVGMAQGDYVLFLNSDDSLASRDVLQQASAALAQDPDFLYGATVQRRPDGTDHLQDRMSLTAILQRMPFCHNSVFLRRSMVLDLGGHDTQFRIAADYDLMLRMIAAGYRGQRLNASVSLFWDRGASGDDSRTGQDYARIWMKFYADLATSRGLTEQDFARFYRRGHMPVGLLLAVLRRPGTSAPIQAAARHSLLKSLRRSLQVWRRF